MHEPIGCQRSIFAPREAILRLVAAIIALLMNVACSSSKSTQLRTLIDQDITAKGVNYCVSCELEKRGATTRCDFYGHHHTLRVESAVDALGNAVPELIGDTLHYLDSDESAALIDFDDFHDKRVRVTGRLFAREHTISVETVDGL